MATQNTGNKGYLKLVKVTTDGTDRPLDDNNMLCSDTGLTQSVKDNLIADPDYIATFEDFTACPLPPPEGLYNPIMLAYYATTDVCDKTQASYQIQNVSFDASSLIYNIDNSVAATGYYSDGTNKAYWNGTILSSYESCTPPPTSYGFSLSSPGRSSSGLACAETNFPLTFYAATNFYIESTQLYVDPDLTTPVGSGNLWYQDGVEGVSIRIDNSGIVAEIINCTI